MLYRAIFGAIPLIIVALFVTGAIPLSSVLPGAGTYHAEKGTMGPVRNSREVAAEGLGRLYGVRPDQASLMQEEMREEMERLGEEHRKQAKGPGWAPKSSGWGR